MKRVVNQADEIQVKVIPVILAKTGLRRGEFLDMKIGDVNLDKDIINIRQKAKRSRQVMFVDNELHTVLDEYVEWRKVYSNSNDMWINKSGTRIHKDHPGRVIASLGEPLGLHQYEGPLVTRLTPHCFRHWFTTYLYRAGMDPQYIKWLRGDSLQKEAWQIYNHIDQETVLEEYFRRIPGLL